MKTFYAILIGLFLSGCSVFKNQINTSVHVETEYHTQQNISNFISLVNFIRLNSNVKNVNQSLKNEANKLAFNAGLISQCDKKDGCYLVRPGFDGRIRIDNDYIVLYYSNRYVKIEDVAQAAHLIYG